MAPPAPKPQRSNSAPEVIPTSKASHGRHVTVYDAVASRATDRGFRHNGIYGPPRTGNMAPAPPDEVLSERTRGEGRQLEYSDEAATSLPDSDLLIALHQYASQFMAEHGMGKGNYNSLDETALLALGLLLEETVKDTLGETGHRALADDTEQY